MNADRRQSRRIAVGRTVRYTDASELHRCAASVGKARESDGQKVARAVVRARRSRWLLRALSNRAGRRCELQPERRGTRDRRRRPSRSRPDYRERAQDAETSIALARSAKRRSTLRPSDPSGPVGAHALLARARASSAALVHARSVGSQVAAPASLGDHGCVETRWQSNTLIMQHCLRSSRYLAMCSTLFPARCSSATRARTTTLASPVSPTRTARHRPTSFGYWSRRRRCTRSPSERSIDMRASRRLAVSMPGAGAVRCAGTRSRGATCSRYRLSMTQPEQRRSSTWQ